MRLEPRYRVAIIVDPIFGERLRELPDRMPVWLADTTANRTAAEAVRRERPGRTHLDGVTVFKVDPQGTPSSWCAGILSMVDIHHGQYSADPPYSEVTVIGAAWDPELEAAFSEYGFRKGASDAAGFVVVRAN